MTKRLKKLAQTIYECKYHKDCCPKYRYRIYRLKSAFGAPFMEPGYFVSTVGLEE